MLVPLLTRARVLGRGTRMGTGDRIQVQGTMETYMIITICILSSSLVTILALSAIVSHRISGLLNSYKEAVLIYKRIDVTYAEFREFVKACPRGYTDDDLIKSNTILANRIKMYEDDISLLNVKRDEHRKMVDELISEIEASKIDIENRKGSYEDLRKQVFNLRDDTIERLRRTDTKLDTLLSVIRIDIKK